MRVKYGRHRLENGLTILLCETPHLPLVTLGAFVVAGSDQNPAGHPGLAALVSHLLDEGTESRSSEQISELIEQTGGSLSSFCDRELSGLTLSSRSETFDTLLELTEEMLRRPAFLEDRLEREREKMLSRLRSMRDDPQIMASALLQQQIFGGTPLEHPVLGTPESLSRLGSREVREFHRRKFSPENTILVVVGAVCEGEALSKCRERFSGWSNSSYLRTVFPSMRRQTQPVTIDYEMDKEQVTILVGHLGVRRQNPDYHALQLLDVILGNGPGFTSRIPRRLRDELGLAYTAYGAVSASSGLYPGCFLAAITTSPERRQQALDGLLLEIRHLAEDGVTAEELSVAREFLTGSFVFEFQSNAGIAQFLLTGELFHLGEDYAERYPAMIAAIGPEEVSRVARKYLDTINYTTIVVGPSDKIISHAPRPYSP